MYSLSSNLLKCFLRQKPRNPTCGRFRLMTTLQNKDLQEEITDEFFDNRVNEVQLRETVKVLNKYSKKQPLKWDEVTKELTDLNISNLRNSILLSCVRLNNLHCGMSYYNYLSQTQEELGKVELLLLCKLLKANRKDVMKYSNFVDMFYQRIRGDLFSSDLIKSSVLEVFLLFPNYFWDYVENVRKNGKRQGNQLVVTRAFEIDEPEVGWDFTQDEDFEFTQDFLKTYINFCVRRAQEGKFSVDLINDLVDLCYRKMWCIHSSNLKTELNPLVETLKNNKNSYTLKIEKCNMSSQSVCSNCGLQLTVPPISQTEFDILKKDFLRFILENQKAYVDSFDLEMKRFINFLRNCEPYNCVVDGLNLLYKGNLVGVKYYNQVLKYFLERNFKILVIGRDHSKSLLHNKTLSKTPKFSTHVQFYLTLNVSNDDLFILYSAMHGGLDTYFCAGDVYRSYAASLPYQSRIMYKRWKVSHQYLVKNKNLLSPWTHQGVPQLTAAPKQKGDCFVWHLPYNSSKTDVSRENKEVDWLCVKAVPTDTSNKQPVISKSRKFKE